MQQTLRRLELITETFVFIFGHTNTQLSELLLSTCHVSRFKAQWVKSGNVIQEDFGGYVISRASSSGWNGTVWAHLFWKVRW